MWYLGHLGLNCWCFLVLGHQSGALQYYSISALLLE
jgi:hypothetical protein